jgi:hypothetical protein
LLCTFLKDDFMQLHTISIAVHIGAGALGLAVGLIPLVVKKGGAVHRRWGSYFVAIAAVNLLTATVGAIFFDAPTPLIAATMSATYQYLSSLRALALKDRGPGLVDALLAIAGLGIGGALLAYLGKGTASWTPIIGYSTIGFAMTIALYDLSRLLWRDWWLAKARMLDHGLKMTGAYFAMMSAGFGNVFRDWQPFSQFGPSILALVLAVVFVIRHRGVNAEFAE